MKENIEQKGETKQSFEEKQARLAKVGGINLIGDFEQRRSGWSASGNKAACSECGNTYHFKAQCHIWIKEEEMGMWKTDNQRKGGGQKVRKEKGNRFILRVWKTKNWAQKMKKYRRMK